MKRWGRDYGGTLAGFASMFLLWHVAAVYVVGSALFPPPAAVIVRAGALLRDGTLLTNTAVSLQRILTGMRLAMTNSFVTIVAAELVAANNGLGKMLWDARLYMLVNDIFVALLTLGLLGFVIDRIFRWCIFMFAGRYSPVV